MKIENKKWKIKVSLRDIENNARRAYLNFQLSIYNYKRIEVNCYV